MSKRYRPQGSNTSSHSPHAQDGEPGAWCRAAPRAPPGATALHEPAMSRRPMATRRCVAGPAGLSAFDERLRQLLSPSAGGAVKRGSP